MVRANSSFSGGISQDDVAAVLGGHVTDPFAVFGPRHRGRAGHLLAFDPHATTLDAVTPGGVIALQPLGGGLFTGDLGRRRKYRLRGSDGQRSWDYDDPYRFGPVLGDLDLHLIAEGTHRRLWQALGAHPMIHEDCNGVHFAVWAPNARRVSVVGGFNGWDGRRAPMLRRGAGVWEIFLPGIQPGEAYKFEILPLDGPPFLKADPYALGAEVPPATASLVRRTGMHAWADGDWMATREGHNRREAPITIYEAHLGSWRHRDGRSLTYREAAEELVCYVADMGFTHLELMPLAEYPFGGSWGYQPTGMYAPTSRYGGPDDLRGLIDAAHAKRIGVLMDWVPAHFPNDAHGLASFDGTHLYEHADPREGFHPDWNTLIYNFGRNEVRNFLTANAIYWLREFHLDGLRVDAVASMLYRDYSRAHDAWIPNQHGGRENYEAIAFLQEMNRLAYGEGPAGLMTVAEESTAWPGVTQPVHAGGLGFGYKWNMGWMNDTLRYIEHDPIHRRHHHDLMTFGLVYGFSENYVLPISHDEVVHGKGSMLQKMPGDAAAKLVRDLNTLYRAHPALHARDTDPGGFAWIDREARADSVFSWLRLGHDGQPPVAVVSNFTPVERRWRLGLPRAGRWREALNTDAGLYGGGNRGNMGAVEAAGPAHAGQPHSAEITLPPLSTLFLTPEDPS